MDCGIPFCHHSCPVANLIPEWNDLARRDDWQEAIERLHSTNNFPEFTGKLCPAPCEGSCVLNLQESPVTIKQIEWEIIDQEFQSEPGQAGHPPEPHRQAGRVMAPGRPAGRRQQLTRGHTYTVFERASGSRAAALRHPESNGKGVLTAADQMRAEGTRSSPGRGRQAAGTTTSPWSSCGRVRTPSCCRRRHRAATAAPDGRSRIHLAWSHATAPQALASSKTADHAGASTGG